jgi:hypothetical protein
MVKQLRREMEKKYLIIWKKRYKIKKMEKGVQIAL